MQPFPDALTVKKATKYLYTKKAAIQILSEPEQVQDADRDLLIYVQVKFIYIFMLIMSVLALDDAF